MGMIEERYPWVFLIISIIVFANAMIWLIEGLSRNQNAYVSILFIILNLFGFGVCLSLWRKYRKKNDRSS